MAAAFTSRRSARTRPTDPPTFAVVIPTYDRPVALRRCLDSLAAQRYPRGRFEVIIVDDGSPEFPADVLAAYDPQLRLTLHRQVHAGPAAARNTGAAAARSKFLAFLDDDCRAHPDWLQEFDVAFRARPSRHLLGGQIGSNFPDNLPNWVSELMLQVIVEHYEPRPGGIYFLRTANLAVRLDEFRAAGGFDARFQTAEDREFSDRWLHQGGSIAYVPNARVTHD